MTNPTSGQSLAEAISHYQAGRFQETVQICRQILSVESNNVDAINLLSKALYESGKILLKKSQYLEALECFQKAAILKPDFVQAIGNVSNCLLYLERFDEALIAVQRVMQLNPYAAPAFNNLGMI